MEGFFTLKKVVAPQLMSADVNGRRNLFQIVACSISDRDIYETSLACYFYSYSPLYFLIKTVVEISTKVLYYFELT